MKALVESKNEVRILCLIYPTAGRDHRYQRLNVKTNLKLGKLWLDRGEYPRLQEVRPFPSPSPHYSTSKTQPRSSEISTPQPHPQPHPVQHQPQQT